MVPTQLHGGTPHETVFCENLKYDVIEIVIVSELRENLKDMTASELGVSRVVKFLAWFSLVYDLKFETSETKQA
jgi:hypothetical protein